MTGKPDNKESKVERAKKQSRHLRGTIAESLAESTTHFGPDDVQLLKFFGVYQQDDRDVRHERRKARQEEAYQFMVRCAIPGGVLSAEQYLNLDQIAQRYTSGSLRVTVRQGIQFHGVIKVNLKATLTAINEKLITTLSACGDAERNVMACAAPLADDAHVTLRNIAREVATRLRPGTRAYHEIWLDGDKALSTADEEPFYGEQYLPRKFKTGIALADDNCIDVYTQDAGLIALVEGGRLLGFDMVIGGGMGMTHNKPDTSARLAQRLGFIAPETAVEAVKTTATIFRDHGNRADRRHARLKYLIAERGMQWFTDEFTSRAPFPLEPWREIAPPASHDHLGMHEQEDGRWFYGVHVANGRIKDKGSVKIKTALSEIVEQYQPGVTLTAQQNLLLTGLEQAVIPDIERILTDHGIEVASRLSPARRFAMACPALPTCGLAMAESERIMPDLLDRLENLLDQLNLRDEPISIRMTGCPNGCTRPYTADIAFAGRRPDIYHIYVGGGLAGDRVVDLYAADVPLNDVERTLEPLLSAWSKHRRPGETLSDYYQRMLERSQPRQAITGKETPTRESFELKVLS